MVRAGSVIGFLVRIDANRYINDLKKAVKSECEPVVTRAAPELQLYLAKQVGAWLTVTSAKELTPEELPASFAELDQCSHC
ncbi:hypothetical protein Gpo141_00001517 [Globisporangium polare]